MNTKYIMIPQGGAARLHEETPTEIRGLYTKDLFSCIGILVVSNDHSRMTLIHADIEVLNMDSIASEFDWVAQKKPVKCTLFVNGTVYKDRYIRVENEEFNFDPDCSRNDLDDVLFRYAMLSGRWESLKKRLAEKLIVIDERRVVWINKEVAVQRDKTILQDPQVLNSALKEITIEYARYFDLREITCMLNGYSPQSCQASIDLQYDGEQWRLLPVLNPSIKKFVDECRRLQRKGNLSLEKVNSLLENKIFSWLKNYFELSLIVRNPFQLFFQTVEKYLSLDDFFYCSKGIKRFQQKDYPQAISFFKQARDRLKNHESYDKGNLGSIYRNLGSAYREDGNYEKAIKNFTKSKSLFAGVRNAEKVKDLEEKIEACQTLFKK